MLQTAFILVGGFLDLVFSIFVLYPVSFIVTLLIIYFAKLNLWLVVTQSNIDISGPSKASLRKYQVIELINQCGFTCLSAAVLPAIYTFSHLFTTVMLTALINGGSKRSLEMQLNFVGTLCIIIVVVNAIIKGAGEIVTKSQDLKAIFKSNLTKKEVRKSLLACRDIRMYFSSVFYIEKGTFTVFLDSVINNTITVVLASL